jgi:3-hydroxyisobutyrate dehydrogenase-like beta-hydroxyacid dehydrogenase
MGAAVGAALLTVGHDVVWASSGRSPATARRAEHAGLRDVAELERLLGQCELVLSICPPDAAVAIARSVRGFPGIFVDANAISPATSVQAGNAFGGRYVDGGIIGPPPERPGTTRLYLSGEQAEWVAAVFAGARIQPRVLPGARVTAASALKMSYAAWTKGSAALLIAIEGTAQANGVEAALRDEWAMSQPALTDRLGAARAAAAEKGWRWKGEMLEIADTFRAAGEPDGFHLAAAQIYSQQPRPPGDQ